MRALSGFEMCFSVTAVVAASTATLGMGTAAADSPVPINSALHRCDFSEVTTAVQVPRVAMGHGTVVFRTAGRTVTADINMVISNQQNAHYDVGLIQAPRPASATCGPGDPGTTYTGLDTDQAGRATLTITAPLQQGTTGVWVMVTSPNAHNQAPGEFYTSEYVAPV